MRKDETLQIIEVLNFKSFGYFKKSYIYSVARWDDIIFFKYKSKGIKYGVYKYDTKKDVFYRLSKESNELIEREVNIYE